ncbi:class B sortase [Paenibacillus thalictri]|uniref:Class B sortase n=2 Tax=Paenibacillus thalictri TaxID=2527873 RepID=A0A4Q9DL79_9BACL|nr:class B sortase [Paenibacillus thalictri]
MRSGEAGADRAAAPDITDSVGAERAAAVPDIAERLGAGRAASSDIAGMLPAGASLPSQLQLPFPVIRDSFRGLLALNPDIVGWVKVGDTSIDYPVLQAADNEYYLHRSYKREESDAGSIFMDFRNKPLEAERNTILYGHRMKNGTMFGDLKKYMERDFFEKHRTFRYDTLSASYDVDIFSVYTTTADVNYIETEFADAAEFTLFLQQIRERSLYKTDMEHGAGDRIITLSTCDYTLDPKAGRLVVHGKLTRR